MAQYPNDKDPQSNWLYPGQEGAYPPQNQPYPYTSRDGAPAPSPPPPPPPPKDYYPPEGPPPDYGYAQSHPDGRLAYDTSGPSRETDFSPPPGVYDTPDAVPPSSEPQDGNNGGIMMSISSFFGKKGPPPMWQRQPPPQLPYDGFPPMCLISNCKTLSKGFPELPPPCQLNPHPFVTHDVAEEDWKRFLADIKKAGSLSPAQRIKSNVIPLVTGMSLVTGFIATFAIEKRMKYKNRGAAGDLVDHWNHYFFGPRRMEVVLCQASERLSGKLGAAPIGDPRQAHMANGLRNDDDDDDSSEDEDEGHTAVTDSSRHGRRAARRERREGRRERRAERRARKARGEDKEPYQLFITAM
ncbi:hypothetical protein J3R82DRAFT_11362 [Butyriboletus roseoflavus]|nr:hypothetical protein J3R82DRAFT_11362 [Butyriboletus roseoflavus]